MIASGGAAHGVKLMSEAGCERIFEEQIYTQDLVLPMRVRLGMGFGLPSPEVPISPNARACFWGGWGGSLAVIDLDARMSFAYVMNRMGEGTVGDDRGASLLLATYMSLRRLKLGGPKLTAAASSGRSEHDGEPQSMTTTCSDEGGERPQRSDGAGRGDGAELTGSESSSRRRPRRSPRGAPTTSASTSLAPSRARRIVSATTTTNPSAVRNHASARALGLKAAAVRVGGLVGGGVHQSWAPGDDGEQGDEQDAGGEERDERGRRQRFTAANGVLHLHPSQERTDGDDPAGRDGGDRDGRAHPADLELAAPARRRRSRRRARPRAVRIQARNVRSLASVNR